MKVTLVKDDARTTIVVYINSFRPRWFKWLFNVSTEAERKELGKAIREFLDAGWEILL